MSLTQSCDPPHTTRPLINPRFTSAGHVGPLFHYNVGILSEAGNILLIRTLRSYFPCRADWQRFKRVNLMSNKGLIFTLMLSEVRIKPMWIKGPWTCSELLIYLPIDLPVDLLTDLLTELLTDLLTDLLTEPDVYRPKHRPANTFPKTHTQTYSQTYS